MRKRNELQNKSRKTVRIILILILLILNLCGCSMKNKTNKNPPKTTLYSKKEYDLPIRRSEKKEAENDCEKHINRIKDIYRDAEKGNALNAVLSEHALKKMAFKMKEAGSGVRIGIPYSNMANYKNFEYFLKNCMIGKKGTSVIYEILRDGGFRREKYIFDGKDMYVLTTNIAWKTEKTAVISDMSYTKLKKWEYTKRGWFCYELCVPEYPEVAETINGSCLVRVKPMSKQNRELSKKCVLNIGYQGNNLLCSNWNGKHLKQLDYNGIYEYLYSMKYHKRFHCKNKMKEIPKREFENLIMEYLPVSSEDIEKYAVFDKETQAYKWEPLGCGNYAPSFFGTSVPEVVETRKNRNKTVTLTVNAVCDMILCDDAVITHELTVRFREDGSFRYLSNKVLGNGLKNIPAYQYRLRRTQNEKNS